MKKVPNIVWATAFLFTVVTVLSLVAIAEEFTWENHSIYDLEGAWRVKTTTGDTYLCLITQEGAGFTGDRPQSEIALTCAQVATGDETLKWQFCIGGLETLRCVPPGTRVKNALAAPRSRPDVFMGVM